jgi:hypothetical protein
MNNLNKFLNAESLERIFSFRDKKFVEHVAKYPKILYTPEFYLGNFSNFYPENKKNIFSLRIDVDEFTEDDFRKYIEILKPYKEFVTLFCSCSAFRTKEYLLKELKDGGFDIQSHGYYHYVYNDYENNYHNIKKAKDFFIRLGIETKGFAAPLGKYNNNLMCALENLGYIYSSDFSFDYLNFPHFPKLKNKFSKVLQIPIFPICPELLFLNGFESGTVINYYDELMSSLENTNIPIIIYAHTDSRYPRVKDFLKQFLSKVAVNDRLYKCNISGFVSFCLKLEDQVFSKSTGLLDKKIAGSLKSPGLALLGEPVMLSPLKRIKRLIKNVIDFETVTPAQELKGSRLKNSLKLFFRKLKGGKICQN